MLVGPIGVFENRAVDPSLPRQLSLPEQIAGEIVRLAALGRYPLGSRLPEAELAADFRVSRVPIREALRLLESRGIAVASASRGMRLMTVRASELRQMLAVRASLERLAVREMTQSGIPMPIAELKKALADIRSGARHRDAHKVAGADLRFHRSLCQSAQNSVLLEFWDALSTKMTIIFGAATRTKDLGRLVETHSSLFSVIEQGSPSKIEDAIEQHIMRESELDCILERASSPSTAP